jgi:predicted  nucleic acid-binding Zn-ribbon protein
MVDIFGFQLDEMEVYVLLIIVFAILVALVTFMLLRSKGTQKVKNVDDLYIEFTRLGDEKARLKAKMAALEEMKNGGRVSQKEYESQLARMGKQVDSINSQMDIILKTLALPHYDTKLQQERTLETEKMSLLVRLQQESNEHKRKIEELEGTVEDLNGRNQILDSENTELRQKLDNVENTYKNRVIRLEQEIDTTRKGIGMRRNPESLENQSDSELRKYKEKIDEYYHKILLYQLLVSRYKSTIETNETKTVPDVESLVQPTNSNLLPITQKIKSDNRDTINQYQAAYDFMDEIHSVPHIGATLWLSIKEMLDNKVADYEDKAILLCSILRGLGASAHVLVASMTDGSNRPLVLLVLKDKSIMLDPNKKHDFLKYVGKRNETIKQFSVDETKIKRILYEFNDKDYISHEE